MVHVVDGPKVSVTRKENISGTHGDWIQQHAPGVNVCGQSGVTRASPACSFVVADWRERGEPFCGGPTVAGSPYCAIHQPLCVIARDSIEGRSRVAALMEDIESAPEPPPELAHLRETALPDALPDDAADLRAVLDHPPPGPGTREFE